MCLLSVASMYKCGNLKQWEFILTVIETKNMKLGEKDPDGSLVSSSSWRFWVLFCLSVGHCPELKALPESVTHLLAPAF